jgi:hypothetical protein
LVGAGWSLRHFLDKFKQWHFHSASNEVKLHAGVKNCHFGNFSDRAGMARMRASEKDLPVLKVNK